MAYEPGDLAIKMDGYKLNIRSVGIVRWTRENRRKLTRYSKT